MKVAQVNPTKRCAAFEIELPLEPLFHERTIARQARIIELRIVEQIDGNGSNAT